MQYPRRRLSRAVLRFITGRLIHTLGDLHLSGVEHVPTEGPVILAANHFNFVDPALVLYASPRMVEFIGGANRPNSPLWAQIIPQLWGFIRAYRGGFSRSTFRLSLSVLQQGGVLGIFPEGGSWAALLRPARPRLHCRTKRCLCGASKHYWCSGPAGRRQNPGKNRVPCAHCRATQGI